MSRLLAKAIRWAERRASLGCALHFAWILLSLGMLAPAAQAAGWTARSAPGLSAAALGGEPRAIALSEAKRLAGVALRDAMAIALVDIDTGNVVGQVAMSRKPAALVFDDAGARVYVLFEDSNSLAVVDVASRSMSATWRVGVEPAALAFDAGRSELVVADGEGRRLYVLDPATGAAVRAVALDFAPRHLALSANGQRLLVGGQGILVSLDAASLGEISRVAVGDRIVSLAWWEYGALALAVGKKQDALNVIDAETGLVTARVALDGDPDSVSLSQGQDRASCPPGKTCRSTV
jgi:YVTN family beta-propeller protein